MHAPPRSHRTVGALERIVAACDWQEFLEGLTVEFTGLPAILDVESPGQTARPVARGVLDALGYDPRSNVIAIAVRIPTPGAIAVLRHLVANPVTVNTVAQGLSPSTVIVWDSEGDLTRLRVIDPAACGG